MYIIFLGFIVWLFWKYGNHIFQVIFGSLKSRQKMDYNALSYSLSAVLETLTPQERILFRDSIDALYRSLKKIRGRYNKVDVRNVTVLYSRADGVLNATPEAKEAIRKTLELIEKSAKLAPPNLESELSLDQIYIFLKDNI